MKRAFFLIFTLWVIQASAQQKPQYTQYILNQYIINPALTGIENYTEIKMSHRHQWTGIDGGPVTSYFTMQTPLGKKDYRTTATSYSVPGYKTKNKSYTTAAPHHGVGFQVIKDEAGPLSNVSAYATYAYHIGITSSTSLAAGFGAGFNRYSLNASALDFNTTTIDPVVYSSGILNSWNFDMSTGLYLYSKDYFIGLSAQQIIPSRLDFSDNAITTAATGITVPHLFATVGYRFYLSNDFHIIPSLMLKYVTPSPCQVEANIKLQFRDLFWAGAGYRVKDGFSGMVGLNVTRNLSIGYSYDYTSSALNTVGNNTHEFVVGYIIGNKFNTGCSSKIW